MTNIKTKHAMNSLTKVIIFFTVTLLFLSCSKERNRLEYALQMAGENRNELEKVLKHYENDSLKLKAAIFLIENMPGYYSYEGALLDSMKAALATCDWRGYIKPEVKKKWSGYSNDQLLKIYDVNVITADYLIKNIDQAFQVWQKRPWGKYLEFNDFCEYILPYRIGNEPLENWREVYYEEYGCLLDSVYQGTDLVKAANVVLRHLRDERHFYNSDFNLPHLGALYNLEHKKGNCQDRADITVYLFRALGIPTTIDFYTYSPGNLVGHIWNAVRDTTGEFIPFAYTTILRGNKEVIGTRIGKAYRLCYGQQPELYPGISEDSQIPPFFRHRYKRDCTENYLRNSIELNVKSSSEKFLYLGVFRGMEWMGIDMSQIKNEKAVFHNIEPGNIYEPLYYDGKNYLPADYPILVEENGFRQFIPDTVQKEQIKLIRKYPYFYRVKAWGGSVAGAKIEYAANRNFSSPQLLHQITDSAIVNYNSVKLNTPVKCRYIRYTAPQKTWLELAELQFYNGDEQIIPIGAEGSKVYYREPWLELKNCYDNNPLTYFTSSENGGKITFDLGKDATVDHIVYMPRNDDNFIRIGDIYELYYQAGEKGWALLERQVADKPYLIYNNVPSNALLYLHNATRGKEEFPFYMEKGEQIFWKD